ncbi:MAG: diaminopimelate epimerase [Parachlamydiales bacterium]|nr:diaminopimelate epimerase [Verrucomicrobiota bacterium]MBX3718599.1 diaminopimelate epimerase [Candidatus Acheromyda pituitae]
MKIPFVKYHGAGNDFILVDDRQRCFPVFQKGLIAALCRRSLGIGADGLILLQPSSRADFQMRIFNSDGSEPAMCGNGIRCLAAFIKELGWENSICTIETKAGLLQCRYANDRIGIHLGSPKVLFANLTIAIDGKPIKIDVVDTGVPHGVVFVEDLHSLPFADTARPIRFDPQFSPGGINVNFAKLLSDGSAAVRTYERGVEEETLSCGTGAAAVGYLVARKKSTSGPVQIRNKEGTHILDVLSTEPDGVELWGEAVRVFEGSIQTTGFQM